MVREELDSAPRSFHPKGLCFCGSLVRATRILNGLPPFPAGPQYTHPCATRPLRGLSEFAVLADVWGLLPKIPTAWGLYHQETPMLC